MTRDAVLVYAPDGVREIDRIAIEELGIAGFTLMRRAGQAMFDDLRERFPDTRQWLIVCGAGNNAGDGFVLAGLARDAYLDVKVATLADPTKLAGDAARAFAEFDRDDGEVVPFTPELCVDPEVDLIVDALLGTGLARPLDGAYRDAVAAINRAAVPVAAVDIPSGLNGLDGSVMGDCVRADLTSTFVGLKQGMYVGQGPAHCGEIRLHRLGIPRDATGRVTPLLRVFGDAELHRFLPERTRDVHKGRLGHVLIVGGNAGMGGAARLAGEAALRCGAGLVTVATRAENVSLTTAYRPELMCHGINDPADLAALLERASLVAVGPGLGRDAWAQALLDTAVDSSLPCVVDADALNLLAARPRRRDAWILTPHPGEAARLLDWSTAEVQARRRDAVLAIAERFGGVALLKGFGTLVARFGELPWLITAGNPAMATAGMGDVLTGITAGLVAQAPDDLLVGAAAAAHAHARAGDEAARGDQRGLLASDLFAQLRACLNP